MIFRVFFRRTLPIILLILLSTAACATFLAPLSSGANSLKGMASSGARTDHASSSEESFEDSTSQSLETENLVVVIDAGNLHGRQDIFRLVDRWNAKVVKTVSPNNETDAFRVMIPQRARYVKRLLSQLRRPLAV